jgi:hypothetical protein
MSIECANGMAMANRSGGLTPGRGYCGPVRGLSPAVALADVSRGLTPGHAHREHDRSYAHGRPRSQRPVSLLGDELDVASHASFVKDSAVGLLQLEDHATVPVARLEVDVSERRVEPFCRIVGLDAEGDSLEAVLLRPLVDRFQQAAPDPASTEPVDDCNRELGSLVVDVAVAVLGFGEEPIPGRADRPAVRFCNERDVPCAAPTLVVDHGLAMREHDIERRELRIRPPGERGVEHLAQKRELVRRKIADLDRHN